MSVNRHTDNLSPEQAKLIESLNNKSSSNASSYRGHHGPSVEKTTVVSEHKWISKKNTGDTEAADQMSSDNAKAAAIAKMTQDEAYKEDKVQEPGAESNFRTGDTRRQSDSFDPNVKGPSRAQELFSLRQTPTGLLSSVPRQKFQYVAAFRFANDNVFESIFKTRIDAQVESNMSPDQDWDYPPDTSSASFKNGQKIIRQNVMRDLRKELVWNIKSIDGPKVNLQLDVLNQYNRKRNVYRTRQYDPVNVTFYDTMNSSAMNLWRWLYEFYVLDGRNKSSHYWESPTSLPKTNYSVYGNTTLSPAEQFVKEHHYGLNNDWNDDYLIKSLDLFLIHGQKYTLVRYVNPKITGMDHDIFSYDGTGPVEIRMQFAYETVLYETINTSFDNQVDSSIDLKEVFKTIAMPETPTVDIRAGSTGGGEGSLKDDSYLTKMTGDMNLQETLKGKAFGTGTNNMSSNQRGDTGIINKKSSGVLGSILGGTPISDAIDGFAKEVYNATRSVVSGIGKDLSSMGSSFSNSSSTSKKTKNTSNTKYITKKKDNKGHLKKNKNKNIERDSGWEYPV